MYRAKAQHFHFGLIWLMGRKLFLAPQARHVKNNPKAGIRFKKKLCIITRNENHLKKIFIQVFNNRKYYGLFNLKTFHKLGGEITATEIFILQQLQV